MKLRNLFNREADPAFRSLDRINGDDSHLRLTQAMGRIGETQAKERQAVELGVLAGKVVKVDFESGARVEPGAMDGIRDIKILSNVVEVPDEQGQIS